MSVHQGRWIAALIMFALLLAVMIMFATVDLGLDQHTLTDVSSAPVSSGVDSDRMDDAPPLQPEGSSPPELPPTPED